MSDVATECETGIEPKTKTKQSIMIGTNCKLTLADANQLASGSATVSLSSDSFTTMDNSYRFLRSCIDQRMPIYGINTHFGDQVSLIDTNINADETAYYNSINSRQENLIKSHSCGLGPIIPPETIRVAIMLRAHCISQGYSGVTHDSVEAMIAFLNAGITPIVRQYGSIGASGDLIPLAMIAAGLTGENVDVLYQGNIMKAHEALSLAGLLPFKPQLRDGLAMINGTSFMTAIASLAVYKLQRLFTQMLYAIAMSLESMMVITSAYNPLVHQLKRQTGEMNINDIMIECWKGSHLLTDLDELRSSNHNSDPSKKINKPVQDYYSLRAVSQGFGPFEENLKHAIGWVEREMNSINDNPIIDTIENKIHHNANFMGYYITEASDILKMDIAQASTWLHALLANLVHPRKNCNLPANLVEEPGKHNGFRPIQLLAASLAVQNRKLAQSHQSYMLPTEGDNQDVNSLGTHAAFDLQESVNNLERLTAIQLLATTQALELRGIEKASKKSQAIHSVIRQHSPSVAECRPMSEEINAIISLLMEEKI